MRHSYLLRTRLQATGGAIVAPTLLSSGRAEASRDVLGRTQFVEAYVEFDAPDREQFPHVDQFTLFGVDSEEGELLVYDKNGKADELMTDSDGLLYSDTFRSLPDTLYNDEQRKELPVATTGGISNRHLVTQNPLRFPSVRVSATGTRAMVASSGETVDVPAGEELVLSLSPEYVETAKIPQDSPNADLEMETIPVVPQVRVVNHGELSVVALRPPA